jgi:hypothetical protein
MKLLRTFTILTAFLAVTAVIQLSSAAPDSERGVVLVEGVPMDRIPDGEMTRHAGVRVAFINYEVGVPDALVVLELLGDGGGVLASDTVAIGGDPAGGRHDVDGMVGYLFRSLLPAHESGLFTFRLTVDATGSMGADHKVLTFSAECGMDDDEGGGDDEEGGDDEGGTGGVDIADAAAAVESQPGFAG